MNKTGKALERKGKRLFMPFRVALTGRMQGPDVGEVMDLPHLRGRPGKGGQARGARRGSQGGVRGVGQVIRRPRGRRRVAVSRFDDRRADAAPSVSRGCRIERRRTTRLDVAPFASRADGS